MSQVILEDWISQYNNLKPICDRIVNREIVRETWYQWELLVGACYPQGKPRTKRKYTDEQTRLFLCLAWFRRQFPKVKLTYTTLRDYHTSNDYKIEEVFDFIANSEGQQPKKDDKPKVVKLAKVKRCCDEIINSNISRKCWRDWKKHLGIEKRIKEVDEGTAALLTYIACWRHDHPRDPLPSPKRLLMFMQNEPRVITIESACSSTQLRQWQLTGCPGKDLHRYLTARGFRVSQVTLYTWGGYSRKAHYSPADLYQWEQIAAQKRRITANAA